MTRIAVLLPGIMGSELKLREEVIWPGSATSLIFPYKQMEALLSNDLQASDVIRSFSISEQYGALIRDLTVFGFVEGNTLVVCPYDWRKSNLVSADVLASKLDDIVRSHGETAEIYLVAHSMGGLISRYYLESGRYSARPGYRAVKALFTLGTPHRGAPLAVSAALGREKRLFLNRDQVSRLVNDPRYPSLYELFPDPSEPCAWSLQTDDYYEPVNLYDDTVVKSLGLSESNVESARRFRAGLDLGRRPETVRYFFFVGTRQVTMSLLRAKIDRPSTVETVEIESAGDGTVPIWSGTLTGVQHRPVGGEHHVIYQNDDVRRTLARLFGYVGVLAAVTRVEVSVRDRVVEPQATVYVAVSLDAAQTDLKAELRIERVNLDSGGRATGTVQQTASYPLQYRGVSVDRFTVSFEAPNISGLYQVGFYVEGRLLGQDHLFVQEPVVTRQ